MAPKTWRAGDHEVIEVIVRQQYEPYDRIPLRQEGGGVIRWTVLWAEQDPHGWRLTAMRCLDGCREHPRKR